jgi:hypothetical protein
METRYGSSAKLSSAFWKPHFSSVLDWVWVLKSKFHTFDPWGVSKVIEQEGFNIIRMNYGMETRMDRHIGAARELLPRHCVGIILWYVSKGTAPVSVASGNVHVCYSIPAAEFISKDVQQRATHVVHIAGPPPANLEWWWESSPTAWRGTFLKFTHSCTLSFFTHTL